MKQLAALLWGSACVVVLAGSTSAGEVSRDQVQAWVRALDADQFLAREDATEQLAKSGKMAVDVLAAADLPAQNLEVVSRAMHVLQELALSEDLATEHAARTVLEKLADSPNSSAAYRAKHTLAALNQLRQGRAIAALEKLGATISVTTSQIGPILVHEVFTLEIGDDFRGTADDLHQLQFLEEVRMVRLEGAKVNDDVVAQVMHLPSLLYLTIKRAEISNRALQDVAKLNRLQHLSVLYSPIDDGAVEFLRAAPQLTDVRLFGTEMTPAGAAKLETALVNAKIDYRRGAFLGIGCQATLRGCEVTIVHPDSAAARSGLQPGDIITRFTGEVVPDFETLTALIARYKPGETVTFEVLRGSGSEKIEVTLGEWE
jgi:hypothetical protein